MPRISVYDFYDPELARCGDTAQGLHFYSENTQQTRFRVLRELLPESLSDLTLVDIGCGFGDLLLYLREQDDAPAGYIGMDLHERMVSVARERTGAEIRHGDVLTDALPAADWYLASGSLNNLTRDETRLAVERCYAAARQGIAFNLLQGKDQCQTFNYRQPEEIEDWARELGAEFHMVDGYVYRDFSVSLVKPRG